jgi:hypothetical protein
MNSGRQRVDPQKKWYIVEENQHEDDNDCDDDK